MMEGKAKPILCPVCDLELPLSGDERPGEQVQCIYCQTPLKIRKSKEDVLYADEDY